jgi:hypothetical protein
MSYYTNCTDLRRRAASPARGAEAHRDRGPTGGRLVLLPGHRARDIDGEERLTLADAIAHEWATRPCGAVGSLRPIAVRRKILSYELPRRMPCTVGSRGRNKEE